MTQQGTWQHRYSNNIRHKTILILGPYPPPLGGISVHIKRVHHKLQQQENKVHLFDTTTPAPGWRLLVYVWRLAQKIIRTRPQVVYMHTLFIRRNLVDMVCAVVLRWLLRYHLVVVDHDCRYLYEKQKPFLVIWRWLHRHVDRHIAIGSSTQRMYKECGMTRTDIEYEGAFLPPLEHERSALVATYPKDLFTFISRHTPVLSANAFQLVQFNGNDLYGITTCIQLLSHIRHEFSQAGIVIMLAQQGDKELYEQVHEQIAAHQLSEHVFFMTGQKELWPLFSYVDLFVRPSLSDSFGVSIAEAVHYGVPAVATDVCVRPAGTRVVPVDDYKAFVQEVMLCLQEKNYAQNSSRSMH